MTQSQLPHLEIKMVYASDPRPKYAIGQPVKFTGKVGTSKHPTYISATGVIHSYQIIEGKIYYVIAVNKAIGENSPKALEWLHENKGFGVQILEDRVELISPKLKPGQNVWFKALITMSAVVDGEAEWDEEEQEYLYSVKNAKFLNCPEDIYFEETSSLLLDEEASIFPEDRLYTLRKQAVNEDNAADNLPSCEFDPN